MARATHRQITILPNLSVSEPIRLEKYTLISRNDIENWIPRLYRQNVDALARLYRSVNGKVTDVGLVVRSRETNRLGLFAEEEEHELRRVVDALAYSAYSRGRPLSLARDNFEMTTWSFPTSRVPKPMINIRNRRFGFQLVDRKDHMLQLPTYVNHQTVSRGAFDDALLQALLRCVYSGRNEDLRIMRSIDWINQANTDSESITEYTRMILFATAFEALIGTPERGGVLNYFVQTIQLLLGESSELDRWSRKFYQRRSGIVHGDALPQLLYGDDKHSSYLNLAGIVFHQCLIRKLGLMAYWPDANTESARRMDVRKYLISNKRRFRAINKFHLAVTGDWARTVYNFLHTIQKDDVSASEADCIQALRSLLRLGLQSVRRLAAMGNFRDKDNKEMLGKYKLAFESIQQRVKCNRRPYNVNVELMGVRNTSSNRWLDARLRSQPIGGAKAINLGAILRALRDTADVTHSARMRERRS